MASSSCISPGLLLSGRRTLRPLLNNLLTRAFASKNIGALSLSYDIHYPTADGAVPEQTNPLVIVHGLFGHKQNWRGVAKALQKAMRNRVFVVDMRNHGDSPRHEDSTYPAMAADLRNFLEKEVFPESGYKTAFLLGHSMGGKVVAEFAMDPANCKFTEKLIIEDVAPHRSSHSAASGEFRAYIDAMRKVDMRRRNRAEIAQALERHIADDSVRAFLLTNLQKPRAGPFKWRFNLDALGANLDHLLSHQVGTDGTVSKKCSVPTLFLSGSRSLYMTPADNPALAKMFPYAKFEQIPEAGHWVHSEKPEQFIDAVTRFLRSGYFTYGSSS